MFGFACLLIQHPGLWLNLLDQHESFPRAKEAQKAIPTSMLTDPSFGCNTRAVRVTQRMITATHARSITKELKITLTYKEGLMN